MKVSPINTIEHNDNELLRNPSHVTEGQDPKLHTKRTRIRKGQDGTQYPESSGVND
jgi:hypothetical protein